MLISFSNKKERRMEKHREVREKPFSWELEETVQEKKQKEEENQWEFKFTLLDLRIEHLGDLENLKWRA